MATVLESFEFRRCSKYPLDQWFDGRVWRVTRGKDFAMTARSFAKNVYTMAQRRGGTVQTATIDENTVVFQFTPKP